MHPRIADMNKTSAENQMGVIAVINNAPLRTRRALSPQTLKSHNDLLVLNVASLNVNNASLALT